MKNMGSIRSSHSKQVLQPRKQNYGCNCKKKENCLLDKKYLISNNSNGKHKKYVGVALTSFK